MALICVTQFWMGSAGHTPHHTCTAALCSPAKSVPAWRTGPCDVVQQRRPLRLRNVQVGSGVATRPFSMFPGSRVPMGTPSRADDAMGWLPRAAPGSGEAIGAVPRSRSPCRRPGWGSQVVGLRSSHARRFRRRWCNWGHNAQVPGPCGGPRKRARGDGAPDATRFKLWWGGCRSAPPATFELGTAGGAQSFT